MHLAYLLSTFLLICTFAFRFCFLFLLGTHDSDVNLTNTFELKGIKSPKKITITLQTD